MKTGSGQRDQLLVALLLTLELEEVVVAAVGAVGILAANAGARVIHRAAALLLVEQHARRVEDPVLLVPQEVRPVLGTGLGEFLLGLAEAHVEMPREALDI